MAVTPSPSACTAFKQASRIVKLGAFWTPRALRSPPVAGAVLAGRPLLRPRWCQLSRRIVSARARRFRAPAKGSRHALLCGPRRPEGRSLDHVRGFFGDHDDWGVGVAGGHRRHDRRINDAQAGHPPHAPVIRRSRPPSGRGPSCTCRPRDRPCGRTAGRTPAATWISLNGRPGLLTACSVPKPWTSNIIILSSFGPSSDAAMAPLSGFPLSPPSGYGSRSRIARPYQTVQIISIRAPETLRRRQGRDCSYLLSGPRLSGARASREHDTRCWTELIPSGTLESTTASWQAEPAETEPAVGQHRLVPFRQFRGVSGD